MNLQFEDFKTATMRGQELTVSEGGRMIKATPVNNGRPGLFDTVIVTAWKTVNDEKLGNRWKLVKRASVQFNFQDAFEKFANGSAWVARAKGDKSPAALPLYAHLEKFIARFNEGGKHPAGLGVLFNTPNEAREFAGLLRAAVEVHEQMGLMVETFGGDEFSFYFAPNHRTTLDFIRVRLTPPYGLQPGFLSVSIGDETAGKMKAAQMAQGA